MKQEESNYKDRKDRCWNCLYWAHITVFIMFTALIAWEVYSFAPSFPRQPQSAVQALSKSLPGASDAKVVTVSIAPSPPVSTAPDRWSDGEVVSALGSFYQTIITILIALIGIMGVLAGFTLRALSRSAAEETAHEAVKLAMAHFLESRRFAEEVALAVEDTGISSQLERLDGELERVRPLLAERARMPNVDTDREDIDGQVEPQVPGPEQV
jgi:hypothetical protein